jgi:CDP-glucose 4,6-dehydratase
MADPAFWSGKRVFLTGHTGFKGGWLSLWLQNMGSIVKGYALAPNTDPSLFEVARVAEGMESEFGDIRDLDQLRASLTAFAPDIVIHMAAQPLVRLSYREPVETYAVNVMGTVHLLEAARAAPSVRAIVSVTTDKCYENKEWVWAYREDEPMGGRDPYSSSKGCAELVTAAYRASFFEGGDAAGVASARAGNVIGGGDWAEDRLIPDLLTAFQSGVPVPVRNPLATRPWQHVLEPLSGYLRLAEMLWQDKTSYAQAWNFGPREDDARPVQWIVERMIEAWGPGASWERDAGFHPHEARFLKLDIAKAREQLGWQPRWSLERTLQAIVAWHKAWLEGRDMRELCLREIADYTSTGAAAQAGAAPAPAHS